MMFPKSELKEFYWEYIQWGWAPHGQLFSAFYHICFPGMVSAWCVRTFFGEDRELHLPVYLPYTCGYKDEYF